MVSHLICSISSSLMDADACFGDWTRSAGIEQHVHADCGHALWDLREPVSTPNCATWTWPLPQKTSPGVGQWT